jgi:hypothetical protein
MSILNLYAKFTNKASCLAISGLGGHAFGSFKEKGGSHMWLCDDLPYDLTTTRIIVYGYESQLHGSQSFQGLEDLATTLRMSLRLLNPTTTKVCHLIIFLHVELMFGRERESDCSLLLIASED